MGKVPAIRHGDAIVTEAADVYVGSQIGWGLMFGTIDKRPVFVDDVARLRSRPAAIRANELDEAAMPAAKATTADH